MKVGLSASSALLAAKLAIIGVLTAKVALTQNQIKHSFTPLAVMTIAPGTITRIMILTDVNVELATTYLLLIAMPVTPLV